jgi:outer membrane autotransporter protein
MRCIEGSNGPLFEFASDAYGSGSDTLEDPIPYNDDALAINDSIYTTDEGYSPLGKHKIFTSKYGMFLEVPEEPVIVEHNIAPPCCWCNCQCRCICDISGLYSIIVDIQRDVEEIYTNVNELNNAVAYMQGDIINIQERTVDIYDMVAALRNCECEDMVEAIYDNVAHFDFDSLAKERTLLRVGDRVEDNYDLLQENYFVSVETREAVLDVDGDVYMLQSTINDVRTCELANILDRLYDLQNLAERIEEKVNALHNCECHDMLEDIYEVVTNTHDEVMIVERGISLANEAIGLEECYCDNTLHELFHEVIKRQCDLEEVLSEESPPVHNLSSPMADINIASTALLRGALGGRLTDVKGNGNDPFVSLAAGRTHRSQIDGLGYNGNLYGLVGALDCVHKFSGENYLRLGALAGYIGGDTDFFGVSAEKSKSAKQDMVSGALFIAHEFFGENSLKTDVNLLAGGGCSYITLLRTDNDDNKFKAKVRSTNWFAYFELVKNVYRQGNWQVGPWVRVDYNHSSHNNYREQCLLGDKTKAHTFSRSRAHLLDVALGLNVEGEFRRRPTDPLTMNPEDEPGLRVFLRAGYGYQPIRKFSDATFSVGEAIFAGENLVLNHPSKHHITLTAGFRKKFNAHWSLDGSYQGSFSKDSHANSLSLGLGYNF